LAIASTWAATFSARPWANCAPSAWMTLATPAICAAPARLRAGIGTGHQHMDVTATGHCSGHGIEGGALDGGVVVFGNNKWS
jgi:hypothetical protein